MKTLERIKTNNVKPSIPIRNYDWEAYRENYDKGDLIGHGKTEKEAIDDLLIQENDHL